MKATGLEPAPRLIPRIADAAFTPRPHKSVRASSCFSKSSIPRSGLPYAGLFLGLAFSFAIIAPTPRALLMFSSLLSLIAPARARNAALERLSVNEHFAPAVTLATPEDGPVFLESHLYNLQPSEPLMSQVAELLHIPKLPCVRKSATARSGPPCVQIAGLYNLPSATLAETQPVS